MDPKILLLFCLFSQYSSSPFFPSLPYYPSLSSGLIDTRFLYIPYIPTHTYQQPKIKEEISINSAFQVNPQREAQPETKMCLTPGCVKAAAELIQSMDQTADPCSDFYQFACGGFVAETVIPDHQTSKGSFSIVRDKLNERLRKIFESESLATEPKVYEHVRNLYQSCMDTDSIEKNSVNDLKDIVGKLGGWPVLEGEKWTGKDFKWHELSIKASDEGLSSDRMISIGIGTDSKDSVKRILEIDQPGLGLSREYLIKGFKDKDVQAYYNYMVQTAVFMGADQKVAEVEMKEALELELKLAEMSLPREERRNKTALYNPMTIGEVQELYPEIPLLQYINDILGSADVTVEKDEVVNVAVPKYITDFRKYISEASPRAQANYIVWRNVKFAMSYLNKEANSIKLAYNKVITGKAQEAPRWEKCVKSTAGLDGTYLYFYEGSLTNAVGGMYARKHFKSEAKEIADEMVENVRAEFKRMLDEDVKWMDSKTKARAQTKADQITPHIAYAKEILDDDLINEFYQGIDLQRDSYLKNIIRLKKFISLYYVKEFRQPIDKKSWKTHGGAAIVNAFYNPDENSIAFPAGILDGVFFNPERPLYMNYGAIGFVVGHEITHGFDDQGSQKDGDGNLVDWWEPETKKKYLEKAQCIIDQYGNYTVKVEGENLNVNGITTQGENIADNGGIKEAYNAYETIVKRYGPEPILPGLGYSQRQLLWISGASVWCSVRRPASLKNQVLTDPHSPAQFRVNGPFANMPQFGQDWGCPVGSPMRPAKTCSVW
eukprot:GFUD01095301.1.p1 GENE.GFUD01095301.1~~GFUD01095301.1.p1  ORF type:complete len:774 (+),score=162.06 GFUD01095301.1:198-2519(+)